MVDSKASVEQSIIEKVRSRVSLSVNGEDSLGEAGCVSAIRGCTLARWLVSHGEAMPMPALSAEEARDLALLVEEMAADKAADPDADTLHLEVAIDDLMYDHYGLTEEEDTLIERSLGLIFQTDEEEDEALARMMDGMGPYDPEDLVSEEIIRVKLRAVDGG